MANYTDQYPDAKTQAQVDALTLLDINDFQAGLTYQVPESIGTHTDGANPPVFTERFIMKEKTVGAHTINQDLVEFQSYLRENKAYAI